MSRPDRVRPAYLILFASVYAIQGVVVAYFFNFNQGYMEAAGVPVGTIGWVQGLATMPLVLKFLGGPLSDRVNFLGWGHRRPYIILGLVLEGAGLIGLTLVHPGRHLDGFVALAVLAVTGLALYDTCCDGMILDVAPPADRPRVQGTIVAARFLATTACALGFGSWLARSGLGPGRGDGVLWACAGLSLIPMALALALPEPRRAADAERFRWSALGVLVRPRTLLLLAFGALYATVSFGVEINLSPYYASLRFGAVDVGHFAAARYLGRAAGAALVPLALPALGRRTTLVVGVAALALTTAGQVAVGSRPAAGCWGFAFGMANGWDDALFCVLAMEATDPRLAASTFALIMAVSNLGALGGGLFSSTVAALGHRFGPAFLIFAGAAAAALPLVLPLGRSGPVREPSHDAVG